MIFLLKISILALNVIYVASEPTNPWRHFNSAAAGFVFMSLFSDSKKEEKAEK